MTTKLFEGILNEGLVNFTIKHGTLTPFQFGSNRGHQTHDAIYSLLATIHNNQQFDNSPTYCASDALRAVIWLQLQADALYGMRCVGGALHGSR